jgi:hypothetical protein
MSQDRRLDKVAGSLTAKQAVILWLEEIRQYQSVYEYVQFLRGLPENAAPIPRLTGQIGHAVREAMKGRPKEFVEDAVRRAVKDVVFLVKLCNRINFKGYAEQRAWSVMVALLAEMQNRVLTEYLLEYFLNRNKRLARSYPRRTQRERIKELFQNWKNNAETFLNDLYGFQSAVTYIRTHYFDGHEVLFADLNQFVADFIRTSEDLVRMFNDSCTEAMRRDCLMDLDEVRKGSDKKATEQTACLVDMAKADTLDALGEYKAARELAMRHL